MESTLASKSSTAAAKESELKDASGVRDAENADFVVTSAAYPESWSCGFQAIVIPADGSDGET